MATPGRSAWQVTVRDRNKVEVASASGYTELHMTLRHNAVSEWRLTLPGSHPAAEALQADGAGIVVRPEGVADPVLSGDVKVTTETVSASEARIVAEGVSDEAVLASELVYPSFATDVSSTGLTKFTQTHDTDGGPVPAETAILVAISRSLRGITRRRYDWLVVPTSQGRGSTVNRLDRFNTILESVQKSATLGGLNFRLLQSGPGQVSVVISEPQVRPRARFSVEAGNLTSAVLVKRAPTVDEVIVAGAGEGVDRVFTRRTTAGSAAAWGQRTVKFVDQRHTEDLAEMRAAADEELADGAAKAGITLHPVETQALRFGRDYHLGDVVTASVRGRDVQDVVRQVVVTDQPGESSSMVPSVGEPDPGESPSLVALVRSMLRGGERTRG